MMATPKPTFIPFETIICTNFTDPVATAVWDALGEPSTPEEARTNIDAAPTNHTHTWDQIDDPPAEYEPSAHTHDHNTDVTGRDSADCHPIGAVTELQTSLDAKASILYVDSENAAQDSEHIGLIIALG